MSFLLSLFSCFIYISYTVEWINDHVIIPLKEDLEDYIMEPQAFLYEEGEIILDARCYYQRDGVNRTFLSVINTKLVKTYHIYYQVTFPDYGISRTHEITFEIVDEIPPWFIQVPNFRITLNDDLPDFLSGLEYVDNYDSIENIKLTVNTSQVITNRVGIYEIYYTIIDQSGNRNEAISYLQIYDHLPPDIILKKEIYLRVHTPFEYMDYLQIKDNYDLILSIVWDLSLVDFDHLGTYPILLIATDQSGNESRAQFDIHIIDDLPPEIVLKSSPKPISVYQEITDEFILDYVLSVRDNYDDINDLNLTYIHTIDSKRIGNYEIIFFLSDQSGNKIEKKMIVFVIDDKPPLITPISDLTFDVFSPSLHLSSLFDLEDNYYESGELTLKITAQIDMNKIGSYPITVESKDPSGNVFYYRDYIHIVDRIPPMINQLNDILIIDFKPRVLNSYFELNDQYYNQDQIKIEIQDEHVDYEKIGTYPIDIYATDQSGNQTILTTYIVVADIVEPVLVLSQDFIVKSIDTYPLNFQDYIDEAYDQYDFLQVSDVTIKHQVDDHKVGIYEVIYELQDSSSNRVTKTLIVKIDDFEKPVITGDSVTIKQGDLFNPMDGMSISDNSNSFYVSVFPYEIDTTQIGSKTIRYIVTDERGNISTFDRTIYIEASKTEIDIRSYVPVLVISLLGISLCIFVYLKR